VVQQIGSNPYTALGDSRTPRAPAPDRLMALWQLQEEVAVMRSVLRRTWMDVRADELY
jgi:hypothetical protein